MEAPVKKKEDKLARLEAEIAALKDRIDNPPPIPREQRTDDEGPCICSRSDPGRFHFKEHHGGHLGACTRASPVPGCFCYCSGFRSFDNYATASEKADRLREIVDHASSPPSDMQLYRMATSNDFSIAGQGYAEAARKEILRRRLPDPWTRGSSSGSYGRNRYGWWDD